MSCTVWPAGQVWEVNMTAGNIVDHDVIDGDGHIIFPSDDWWKPYLPKKYWQWTPQRRSESGGTARDYVEGRPVSAPMVVSTKDGGLGWGFTPGAWKRADAASITMAEARKAGGADPKDRLQAMDVDGIDIAYLYPSSPLLSQPAAIFSSAFALAMEQAYNDWLYDYCAEDRHRLRPAALIPQQDAVLAVEEMERARKRGVTVAMLRPNPVGPYTIDHPNNELIWTAAEELNMAVALHEGVELDILHLGADRCQNGTQKHVASHPLEMMMASLVLITGGLLERHPRLRLGFMESGAGWAPFWLHRMDEHYERMFGGVRTTKEPPSHYFKRQCFLGVEPDDPLIPNMVDFGLEECLVFSSDFPHVDAIYPGSVSALATRTDLTGATKRKVLLENAQRMYGLVSPEPAGVGRLQRLQEHV
jgi:predicted TIM-barrel fold metal-dependent hydrolase